MMARKPCLCKRCGVDHGKHSTAFCADCYPIYKAEKWQTKACVKCGKEVTRYRKYFETHPVTFCGLDCQRVYALQENHSGKNRRKEYGTAKREWRKQRSAERKAVSIGYQWWRKCKRSYDIYRPLSGWDRRCNSAVSSALQKYIRKTKPNKRKECKTWDKATKVRGNAAKLRIKRQERLSCTWARKCSSVAAGSRYRSRRKLARQRKKNLGVLESKKFS